MKSVYCMFKCYYGENDNCFDLIDIFDDKDLAIDSAKNIVKIEFEQIDKMNEFWGGTITTGYRPCIKKMVNCIYIGKREECEIEIPNGFFGGVVIEEMKIKSK